MTKTEEIALLDKTIKAFGPYSYLGPWLTEVRGALVACIQNDLPPDALLPTAAREQGRLIVAHAETDAGSIRKAAETYATSVREQAQKDADQTRCYLRGQLDRTLRDLGVRY